MASSIPNPDNYLGHLTPADAFQYEVSRNLYLAVLGVSFRMPNHLRIDLMNTNIGYNMGHPCLHSR